MPCDYPPTKLRQAWGEAVVGVLNALADRAVQRLGVKFQAPQHSASDADATEEGSGEGEQDSAAAGGGGDGVVEDVFAAGMTVSDDDEDGSAEHPMVVGYVEVSVYSERNNSEFY